MDMQGMHENEMHNTFWRKKQVVVTFRSTIPLVSSDGVNQGSPILEELKLESQRQQLNKFLAENGLNYTLNFYRPAEYEDSQKFRPMRQRSSFSPRAAHKGRDNFTPPPGVYLFGLSEPIQSDFGEVATSIAVFFDFSSNVNMQSGTGGMMSGMKGSPEGDEADTGLGDDGEGKDPPPDQSPVVRIVNAINKGLNTLNDRLAPISAASPNWLLGGTEYIPQGCPLTPPIPVDDACSFWHFHLPQLSPEQLHSMTGEGVTVFVLDTLPEHDVVSHAVARAGDDNLLLFDVSRNVTFNYDIWDTWKAGKGDPMIPPLAVGKDVYGRHYAFRMPDHGLFIAGIVHDIAPHARIECIRMMSDYCIGDSNLFSSALHYIQNRMLPGGDLYQRPVVINLSAVMPTIEEAKSLGMDPGTGVTPDVLAQVSQSIQALVQLGAIVVASAGNEADLREHPSGIRPPALHPAAFGNPPDSIYGVIPVGAVDENGQATSYSCYPGPSGVATYGGEIPEVDPADPPSDDPVVTVCDAVRGIYSAGRYPALSKDSPAKQYKAPNSRGWASWVGTSFATPIISAVAARVLEWKLKGGTVPDVPAAIIGTAGGTHTQWNDLDHSTPGASGGSIKGPMLLAVQQCQVMERDEEED